MAGVVSEIRVLNLDFNSKRIWGPTPKYPSVLDFKKHSFKLPIIVAGPCSIENDFQMKVIARELAKNGVKWMRGGVYRAGTYGANAEGFKFDLLKRWKRIADRNGLKIAVEVVDLSVLGALNIYADAFQVGARQMQNYGLLRALARIGKPVFLKRNMGATLDEFLGAAEYIVSKGTPCVLVERGSATHMNHVRWDLSVSIIPAIKRMTKIPVIIDASHGTGRRDLVEPMTLAGMAAGADGFMVEVHPQPYFSISDADQALSLDCLKKLIEKTKCIRKLIKENVR